MENQGANTSKCDDDRLLSIYCIKIKVCPIQVVHSYRNYDGNNKFEKNKNKKSAQNVTGLLKLKM
jgi:hypothetical protein